MPDFVHKAIAKLTAAAIVTANDLIGCTEEDIDEIEKGYGRRLPSAYRGFLAAMGHSAGRFLTGTDYSCSAICTLREQADRLLRECRAPVVLGQADLVFAVHQGCQFLFFDTEKTDDPEIYSYSESEESFKQVAQSFSEWLAGCVDDEIAAARALEWA